MSKTISLIHCADLHLDSAMSTNLEPKLAQLRQIELMEAFLNMVTYASDHGVKAILIAGDFFDSITVSKRSIQTILSTMESHKEISFYYLRGNHDVSNRLGLQNELPSNLFVFGSEWTSYTLEKGVVITGRETFLDDSKHDELNLDENNVNIVMIHGDIYHDESSREGIDLNKYKNKGIDYLALGHLHKHTKGLLDDRGVYVYPGCLEPRGYDEVGDHGFEWIEVNETFNVVTNHFVPFARRNVRKLHINIDDCSCSEDIINEIELAVKKEEVSSLDYVEVILVGKDKIKDEKDLFMIKHRLKDRFFHFVLKDESEVGYDLDTIQYEGSLKGEFIRTVLNNASFSSHEKDEVIRCGIQALTKKGFTL